MNLIILAIAYVAMSAWVISRVRKDMGDGFAFLAFVIACIAGMSGLGIAA